MAVNFSPYSKSRPSRISDGFGIDAEGNTTYTTNGKTQILAYKDAKKQKAIEQERETVQAGADLAGKHRDIYQRIMGDVTLTDAQKRKQVADVVWMAKNAESSGPLGYVKKSLGATFGPLYKGFIAVTEPVAQVAQASLETLYTAVDDATASFRKPLPQGQQKRNPLATSPDNNLSALAKWKKHAFEDETFNIATSEDSSYYLGTGTHAKVAGLAVDVATDWTTYVTAGASAISKLDKAALAARFVVGGDLAVKYAATHPNLPKLFGNIARHGGVEVPADIRKLEGIKVGLKFFGQPIPLTDGLSRGWARSFGTLKLGVKEGVRKGLTSFETGAKFVEHVTRPSVKLLIESGVLKKSAMNVENPKFVQAAMLQHGASAARGARGWTARQFGDDIVENFVPIAEKLDADPTYGQVAHAREIGDRTILSPAAAKAFDAMESILERMITKADDRLGAYAAKHGVPAVPINRLKNWVHHKLTPEAKEAMRINARTWFGDADVEFSLVNGDGASTYRQYIKDEDFLGTKLKEGTIEEINAAYAKFLTEEGLPVTKFFETDALTILNGYGDSLARYIGRVAQADRMMDFGIDNIKPLLTHNIPDPKLVTHMTGAAARVSALQRKYRGKVSYGVGTIANRTVAETELWTAAITTDNILQGQLLHRASAEVDEMAAIQELDKLLVELDGMEVYAATLSAAKRGVFEDANMAMYNEITAYRQALKDGTARRYLALQDARAKYFYMFPGADANDAKNNLEWFAERFAREENGGKALRNHEVVALELRARRIQEQIDALPNDSVNSAKLDKLDKELGEIARVTEGHEEFNVARSQATYAKDGAMYGFPHGEPGNDLYNFWTTAEPKLPDGTFRETPNALIAHATPSDNLVDFRKTEHMNQLVENPESLQDLSEIWAGMGMVDNTWNDIVDFTLKSNKVDEYYASLAGFEEKAELLQGILDFRNTVRAATSSGSDLPDGAVGEFFDFMQESFRRIVASTDAANADVVSKRMYDEWLRANIAGAVPGFDGMLVPMKSVIPGSPDGEWAVMMSVSTPTPRVGDRFTDSVQLVNNGGQMNPLARTILDGKTEAAQLDLLMRTDEIKASLAAVGIDIEVARAAGRQLEKDLLAVPAQELRAARQNMVNVDGVDIPTPLAERRVLDNELAINKAMDEIDADVLGATGVDIADKIDAVTRSRMTLDNARAIRTMTPDVEQALTDEIGEVMELLRNTPTTGATRAMNAQWIRDVENLMAGLSQIGDPVIEAAARKVALLATADTIKLAKISSRLSDTMFDLSEAQAGIVGLRIIDQAEEGWEALRGLGVQMPKELFDKWRPNLNKLRTPAEAGALMKILNRYTGYWKRYVTASVGFVARNGYSGVFMGYTEGITTAQMGKGLDWAIAQNAGGKTTDWMARVGITTPEQIAEANKIMEAVFASSRGVSLDNSMPMHPRWERGLGKVFNKFDPKQKWRLAENPVVAKFGMANDVAERAMRIPMAMDSIARGDTVEQAVARISRIHVDYSDLSGMDTQAKQLIPFWIWTSRNIPLQLTQMVSRPKAYYEYQRFVDRFPLTVDDPTTEEREGVVLPKWLRGLKPAAAFGGFMFAPDMPHRKLQQQIEQFMNAKTVVSQMTPWVKAPIEVLLLGGQAFTGAKFKPTEARGIEKAVATVLMALGGVGLVREIDGKLMMKQQVGYMFEQFIPPLAVLHRLSGGYTGGKETLNERWVTSVLSWFGIPLKQISQGQEENEFLRAGYELGDVKRGLRGGQEERYYEQGGTGPATGSFQP